MGFDVTFSIDDLPDDAVPADGEALDGNEVWFVYRTQHDSHVRPSHAALDASVWRSDDPRAPTPPVDYGCRCYIEYVAAPHTAAAAVLPVAEDTPTTHAAVFSRYLDANLPDWQELADEARQQPPTIRLAYLTTALRGQLTRSDAHDLARMILETIVDGNAK